MKQDLIVGGRPGISSLTLGVLVVLAGACERPLPTDRTAATVALRITAVTVGTPISTLVVQLTASDIPTRLVFNLSVANGVASGTIKIPPGPARTIDVTALDPLGNVTHEGSATIDVRPGQNPPVQIKLGPRSGHVPITVTFGNFGVVVTPATATINVPASATLQLAVTVTDVNGQVIPAPAVDWATTNPAVATVSATGLVTGLTNGTAKIVATYEGVAGLSAISIMGGGGLSFTSLSAGNSHTCAVTPSGAAYCWGWNASGQLGDGTSLDRHSPEPVAGGITFASVSSGSGGLTFSGPVIAHTCGLTPTGVAYCWGNNDYGQLGDETTISRSQPTPVHGGLTFASLSLGMDHTCGLTSAGLAYCWGANFDGALGDGTTTHRQSPAAVAGGLTFLNISAGQGHTCGVTAAGAAYCWGRNATYQLGDETQTNRLTPVAVHGGVAFVGVSAGKAYSCGVTPAGAAYCWGYNATGQLGDGTAIHKPIPTAVVTPPGIHFESIDAGFDNTCGLAGDAVFCWGANASGELGDGTKTEHHTPTAVAMPPGVTFASVSTGWVHTCALTMTGTAYCWGWNGHGQLGDGTTTDHLTPEPVAP